MYGVVGTDGVVYGPVPVAALYDWIAQGRVVPTTVLIDYQGRRVPASTLPELQGAFPVATPVYAPPFVPFVPPSRRKSIALLLAFFVGFLGAHRFYLGHLWTGLAMLVLNLSALLLLTNIPMAILVEIVATVWLVVDMALIGAGRLVGIDGRPLG